MSNAPAPTTSPTPSRALIKSVVLPQQHGGWGFWMEPVIAGLVIAPSAAGALLAIAGLLVFLAHHPLQIILRDRLKGRRFQRTQVAERFALLFGGLALALGGIAVVSSAHPFWLPLLIAAPLAAFQLTYELRAAGREGIAEIAGALTFGALAPMIALAGGHDLASALALWAALGMARAIASVLYIRARLRLEKGQTPSGLQAPPVVIGAHVAALGVIAALAAVGVSAWTALIGGAILVGRAGLGLSSRRVSVPVKVLGFREIAYGVLFAVSIALG